MYRLALLALFLVAPGARSLQSLQVRVEAPPELAAVRTRLESIDPGRFADIARLVGISDVGDPIQVVLATENSDLARSVSPWISGFAVGESDLVVIFPARTPSYPNGSLEDVMRHEFAHVLIWRAASGRPIPRWFNEGLAMAAERERRFADQTQLVYQLVIGSRTSLGDLDHLFAGDERDQIRAYALAGAFVHDVLQRHGPAACSEILMRIRYGVPFDAAFAEVTGVPPAAAESEFWRRQRIWTAWIPVITSSTTLWIFVTLLAVVAIYRRVRRSRDIEKQWEKEEQDHPDP